MQRDGFGDALEQIQQIKVIIYGDFRHVGVTAFTCSRVLRPTSSAQCTKKSNWINVWCFSQTWWPWTSNLCKNAQIASRLLKLAVSFFVQVWSRRSLLWQCSTPTPAKLCSWRKMFSLADELRYSKRNEILQEQQKIVEWLVDSRSVLSSWPVTSLKSHEIQRQHYFSLVRFAKYSKLCHTKNRGRLQYVRLGEYLPHTHLKRESLWYTRTGMNDQKGKFPLFLQ